MATRYVAKRLGRPRSNAPSSTLESQAKFVADVLWERAQKMAEYLAPAGELGVEEADDETMWEILERTATILSPAYWDDPEALSDLIRLRQKFLPSFNVEGLRVARDNAKRLKEITPRAEISPANPEFAMMSRRLGFKEA